MSLTSESDVSSERFLGMAPFLRMSIAGVDFSAITQQMVAQVENSPDDAVLWMNLSTAMMSLKHEALGLQIQEQALAMQRVYYWPARQPAKIRLLMLMVPGNLSANIPLDCLLEESDVDLIYYFVDPNAENPLTSPVPTHDLVMVAIGASDEQASVLLRLEYALRGWSKPILNPPKNVPTSERHNASLLLQNVPGLVICPALHATRLVLQAIACGQKTLPHIVENHDFPIIVRPVGSHGGHGLQKIDAADELESYLAQTAGDDFFVSRFVDYRGADGMFRKMRLVLIDGKPFACHMGVSAHWMIHYVNAGMYEDADKRAQEACFFNTFADFAGRHHAALAAISQRTGLEYIGIDCAETADGELLIFEIDPAMVVHAMDDEAMFPNKQIHMHKVKTAMREMLFQRAGVSF